MLFDQTETPAITVSQLLELSKGKKDFFLLDVRTMEEYITGHLDFTDALIPYDKINKHINLLPTNKDETIYCFCRSGRRSDFATNHLISLGYKNAHNILDGVLEWGKLDYPLETGNVNPTIEEND